MLVRGKEIRLGDLVYMEYDSVNGQSGHMDADIVIVKAQVFRVAKR